MLYNSSAVLPSWRIPSTSGGLANNTDPSMLNGTDTLAASGPSAAAVPPFLSLGCLIPTDPSRARVAVSISGRQ